LLRWTCHGVHAELYNERASSYGGEGDDLEHSVLAELEEPYRMDIETALGSLKKYAYDEDRLIDACARARRAL
jgi:hypothetical protein